MKKNARFFQNFSEINLIERLLGRSLEGILYLPRHKQIDG